MTREEAILWMRVLKHSKINWVGEQAEDEDIIARCEEAEQEAYDMAIEALSADADRPQGEWEERYIEDDECVWTRHRFYCSVCGNWNTYGKSDYCPKCGARMVME